MNKRIFLVTISLVLFFTVQSYSQNINIFSISGGPILGWHIPQIDELNSELKNVGYPELESSGYLLTGGGGYIDIPVIKGLRLGGLGMGFSTDKTYETDNVIKGISMQYSMGGISIEYVNSISRSFDYSLGGIIGIGSFGFKISKYPKDYQNWNLGNFGIDTTVNNNVLNKDFSKSLFIFQPQVSLGFQALKFLYLKLNAGYMLALAGDWKIDDIVIVKNVPSGIKADGFTFSLAVNVGLFVK